MADGAGTQVEELLHLQAGEKRGETGETSRVHPTEDVSTLRFNAFYALNVGVFLKRNPNRSHSCLRSLTPLCLFPPPCPPAPCSNRLRVRAAGNLRAHGGQGGALSLDDTMPLSPPLMRPLCEEIPVWDHPARANNVCVCGARAAEVGRNVLQSSDPQCSSLPNMTQTDDRGLYWSTQGHVQRRTKHLLSLLWSFWWNVLLVDLQGHYSKSYKAVKYF